MAVANDVAGVILMLLPVWGLMFSTWTPTHPADHAALQIVPILFAISYGVVAGRSFGKRTMGLVIRTRTGEIPGAGRLIVRALAKFPALVSIAFVFAIEALPSGSTGGRLGELVLASTLLIGIYGWYPTTLVMLSFTGKTTLHDLIAGTVVCTAHAPRGFPIEPTATQKR